MKILLEREDFNAQGYALAGKGQWADLCLAHFKIPMHVLTSASEVWFQRFDGALYVLKHRDLFIRGHHRGHALEFFTGIKRDADTE